MNRGALSSLTVAALLVTAAPCLAGDLEVTPFQVTNRSPLIQIYGIPAASDSHIVPKGKTEFSLSLDNASSYTTHQNANEQIELDGETITTTLALRHGITENFDLGLSLPVINHGGGFLDQFIINWHNTFSLPQGGREIAPKNRLNYRYDRDGNKKIALTSDSTGIGDLSLSLGYRLMAQQNGQSGSTVALRADLKLPTGDSSNLAGSGSSDLALSCLAGYNRYTEWGTVGVFGSLGILGMTRGEVLPEQQNRFVTFGTMGGGWSPTPWISFKLQLNGHSPLYHGSSLTELSTAALVLTSGGTLKLGRSYLDIGVSEDVAVATAPDVAFHLRLRREF